MTPEHQRLRQSSDRTVYWKRWGPYLSDRQWGTVREDYSEDGNAWAYFPHDQARSRAYRWGEDGLLGISDSHQRLCFGLALWNGNDPILKERLFGLTGPEGNHGEDVKEYYFHLDSTPTHSYMKALYKYPQRAFPYADLVSENQRRDQGAPEYELLDTGIFEGDRYYDVFVEYAKASPEDILIQISVVNRGPEPHTLHLLPTLWFRNTWSWGYSVMSDYNVGCEGKMPVIKVASTPEDCTVLEAHHPTLGGSSRPNDTARWLYCDGTPPLLFTNNETNVRRLYGVDPLAQDVSPSSPYVSSSPYVKDGINDYVVHGRTEAVNPDQLGTKVSPHYTLTINPGETKVIRLRLSDRPDLEAPLGADFAAHWQARQQEAEEFYRTLIPDTVSDEHRMIQRQAFAGLMWTKQWYYYVIEEWLQGDPAMPSPPDEREAGRNSDWEHIHCDDIISMPDKWEYPWFAAWDLAFHCVPLALVDPEFAKGQLDIMTREWYMHPNGQLPAYEWNFGDVNPPVHAWATWRVYQIEKTQTGQGDRQFLERVFQKLLLNFTWWVNRKDAEGNNIFEGGFLGLDNIGVFDRSAPLPTGGTIEQADGTSWMAMFCLNMLTMSLELALDNPVYEDMATKFFEHFLYIADAMNKMGGDDTELWDPEDGFFYDVLTLPSSKKVRLKVRSMVGLIPLFAITVLDPETLEKLPHFTARMDWFINKRPELKKNVACMQTKGQKSRRLLALTYLSTQDHPETAIPEQAHDSDQRFRRILSKMLDETEFLSEYGVRALSRFHADQPYTFNVNDGDCYQVSYEPGESTTLMFGGNSNWRGPVWFPVNYLIIESLQAFHQYAGDDFKVECPTGSGHWMTLEDVALELSQRLIRIFEQDETGDRPVYGNGSKFQTDPHWRNLILFHEYFHGDNGRGLGANHQTGWTGLVATLIQQSR